MSTPDVPPLQMAMIAIVGVFQEHAGKGGDKFTLSKGELKELLQTQFQGMLGEAKDQTQVDEIFNDLDENSDNAVDFMEFMKVVTGMTMMLHIMFTKQ